MTAPAQPLPPRPPPLPVPTGLRNTNLLRQDIIKGGVLRYTLAALGVVFFTLFQEQLPFPYPHLVSVSYGVLVINTVLLALCFHRRALLDVYPAQLFFDIALFPVVLLFSGGFISPFLPVFFATVFASAIVFNEWRPTSLIVFAMAVVSYAGVSLGQKYGILPAPVAYAAHLMANTPLFWFVFLAVLVMLILGYLAISSFHSTVHRTLGDTLSALHRIAEGTASATGNDFFDSATGNLARALNCRGALVFERRGTTSQMHSLGAVLDADPLDPFDIDTHTEPFNACLKGEVVSLRLAPSLPGVPLPPTGNQSTTWYACAQLLDDHDHTTVGLLCVLDARPLRHDRFLYSVMQVFAARTTAEILRRRGDRDRRQMQNQIAQMQKMEAIGLLAGGIAHDVNNHLGAVLTYAELLQPRLAHDAKGSAYAERITGIVGNVSDLTQKLLAFARKGKYCVVPVDLHDVIAEVCDILVRTIDKRIVLDCRLAATPPYTMGDRSQLQSMLLNLAINARDAMPEGGVLRIATDVVDIDAPWCATRPFATTPGTYLRITVADNGCGMSEEVREHLFEPFFTTKPQGKGTGLGLAAVFGCVKNHGGFIEVQSAPAEGTTLQVYLPQHQSFTGNGQLHPAGVTPHETPVA